MKIDWIPVSERLPTETNRYLVTERNYGGKKDAFDLFVAVHMNAIWDNESHEWCDTYFEPEYSNIVAWCNPSPYEGE